MPRLTLFITQIHIYPGLSGQEQETAKRIVKQLRKYHPTQIIENLGGHGVAAIYDTGNPGKTILFRADTDALPIQEINSFAHQSIYEGVSHKCGHDGHTAILVGLAEKLHQQPFSKGKIILLFQPAEEIGIGAKAVINDPKFKTLQPDFVFALHNVPGYPKGQIVCRTGTFNPAVVSVVIKLQGKKAHAAQAENGINPDQAIASLITKVHALQNYDQASEDYLKFTTIYTRIGTKDYGISAGEGELHYTFRSWTKVKLEGAKEQLTQLISDICSQHRLTYTLDWIYYFAASTNDEFAVNCIKQSAQKNSYSYHNKPTPFQWGEDFGLFTEKFPGAMFGLGAGEHTPALHHVDYDFPDDIISYGMETFYGIAENCIGGQ